MKAMNEFGSVLAIAALILGACVVTGELPPAPEAGSSTVAGASGGTSLGQSFAANGRNENNLQ